MTVREYAFFVALAAALIAPILFTPPSEGLRHWLRRSTMTPVEKAVRDKRQLWRGIVGFVVAFGFLALAGWLCDCGFFFF